MSDTKTKIVKQKQYESGRVSVSTYPFTISDGDRKGEVIDLVEIQVIKRKYSDEIKAMYDDRKYVVMTKEEFVNLVKGTIPK